MARFSSYFSSRNIVLIFVTVFLIYIIAKVIRKYLFPKMDNSGYVANREFVESGSNSGSSGNATNGTADILFFYADWCPHCKQAKPEWQKFKEEYNESVVNNYKLNLIDVNCTSELGESGQLIKTYNVEGFPTVKMNVNGKIVEYDAKVSKENLKLFVNKML
jgi:thiol-disulfide isomerase/thioredoxin|tara:strand:- start:593 stop:1078 length:486 start_codon:yes stop_codon:yes gene_type:complete